MKSITEKLMSYTGTAVVGAALGYISGENFGAAIADLFVESKFGIERAVAGNFVQVGLMAAGAVAGPIAYYITSRRSPRIDTTSK